MGGIFDVGFSGGLNIYCIVCENLMLFFFFFSPVDVLQENSDIVVKGEVACRVHDAIYQFCVDNIYDSQMTEFLMAAKGSSTRYEYCVTNWGWNCIIN